MSGCLKTQRSYANAKTPRQAIAPPRADATRRSVLLSLLATPAVTAPLPAHAFGVGFPGYDLNVDARRRAQERNQRELDEQKQRAADFKAAKAAKAAREAAEAEAAKQ
uniref:Uncharacterized protein n=1 Tax=Dunaliella tertiolecta TaxID=3047 RepID=A0A6S8GWH0_DUNTE|mmetsp:Transcript_13765/g.37189  ORF Transcript_13765/g.37189 Transcript_13765/m.37189 type:complete len:108 (+) Transcript_13765:106-429(+)